MFGLGRKKEKKPGLLKKENIRLNCPTVEKDEAIRAVGRLLCDGGYVDESYIDAMLLREQSFPTNIGNGIALPHGVEAAKKDIKHSGIAVMVYPEGVNWGSEEVKLIIGIAGVGEDHLEILSIIAEKMAEPDAVERVVASDRDTIYQVFTEK